MDAFDVYHRDRDHSYANHSTWRSCDPAATPWHSTRPRLNVARACKALLRINRALRMIDLEPSVREKMQRARDQVRQRLAISAH